MARPPTRRLRDVRLLGSIAAAAFALVAAAPAGAAVTATSGPSSTGPSLFVAGDAADDEIAVTCGTDANVKVNGLDPASAEDPSAPGPLPCAELTSIAVNGGDGADRIDLAQVAVAGGFTSPQLCGPCPGGDYAIVAECEAGAGDDEIVSSPIGAVIGGCFGSRSMPGDDVVTGAEGEDAIAGGPGVDFIDSLGGDDQVFGGPGSDLLVAGSGADLVVGKQGDDVLSGRGGDDIISGGPGRDSMRGGAGRDDCTGGPDLATARGCETTRGVTGRIALGFAPHEATAEPRRR